jgi:hypothetical protein
MSDADTLYNMKLHERVEIEDEFYVMRVPGGWIYMDMNDDLRPLTINMCFVPFHPEFGPNIGKYYPFKPKELQDV